MLREILNTNIRVMNGFRNYVLMFLLLIFHNRSYSQGISTDNPNEKYNPEYHFYPSIDPTGLFYYGGRYFLNWGSATSKDLVHWNMTKYGLERNDFNKNIFSGTGFNPELFRSQVISLISGSVVVDWNNSSGLGKNGNPPLIAVQVSSMSRNIAYSNDTAKSWIRYEKPAVIPNSSGTFRDPKVFWYEPDKKWIMVVPWCEIQEIRFFSSKNLVDWEFMSKFGPWGAVGGQWECVEFFPLTVDGDASNIKWVLEISLQPRNGEYFIGDFDGRRFTLDKDFINNLSYEKYFPSGEMLFDFERSIDEWDIEGNAFINCPTVEEETNGKEGYRCIKSNGSGTGKITSPEFTISKKCINFLIGGGYYPGEECVNLLIDGKVVRTQTGNSGNAHLNWTGWDVAEFRGRNARIEIVDNMASEGMNVKGYIYCDAIMLSDDLPKTAYEEYNPGWEKAFWIDWGSDFYAVRAWGNYAPEEKRTIWTGWMGIWTYTFSEPLLGLFSVPRNIELKTFPEGIRLIQNPIKELESLRTIHRTVDPNTFEGIWQPKKFLPSKNAYELIVEFENISAGEFGLNLCVGQNEKTVVGYNVSKEELYVDRRNSGYDDFSEVFPGISKGPLNYRTNAIKLHVFIDKCSIEVLGNDGETVVSSKIYPESSSTGINFFSNNGKVKIKSLELWELGSINLYPANQ
jgi:sucrose-6-phosphate hydrolase SacC (GH32 family)